MNKLLKKAAAFITAGFMAATGFGAEAFAESRRYDATATATIAYEAAVEKPTYTIKGTKGVRKIKLSSKTSGAQIYYTTNGTVPTTKSSQYKLGTLLKITKNVKIKAIAVYGGQTSAVMTKTFKVATMYGDITGDGNINQNDMARLKNYLASKTSYVCKDNADCDGNGTIGANDLTVLKMYLDGSITTLPYSGGSVVEVEDPEDTEGDGDDYVPAATVKLSKPGITVYKSLGGKRVEFTSTTPGVTFYYTLNGREPSTSSTKYTEKFLIDQAGSYTVKVIAYKGGSVSAVQQTVVNVGQTANVITPTSTTEAYADSVKVALMCDTEGSIIYYTTDKTDPRTSATVKKYTGAFDLYPLSGEENATVKAYARSKANADSNISTFTFKVKANFTITGTVWNDTPGTASTADGVKAAGESGIAGIRVLALNVNSGSYVKEAQTDYNGNYTISGLQPANTYKIVFEFNGQQYRPYNAVKPGGNQALITTTIPQLTIKNGGAYNPTGTMIASINSYAGAIQSTVYTAAATTMNTYTESAANVNLALISNMYGAVSLSITSSGWTNSSSVSGPAVMNEDKVTYNITITNNSPVETLCDLTLELYLTDAFTNIVMVKTNNVFVSNYSDAVRSGYRYYALSNLLNSNGLAPGQSVSFSVSGNVSTDIGNYLNCSVEVTSYRFADSVYDRYSVPGNMTIGNPKEKDEASATPILVMSVTDNTTEATITNLDKDLFTAGGRYKEDVYQDQVIKVRIYFEGISGSSDYSLESYDQPTARHSSTFYKLGSGYLLELTVMANSSNIPGIAIYNISIKKNPKIKLQLSFNILSI
ncbi:MAG: chitobiase/beta-hexosaminidase C-terminal domain-containing protein [Ruminiclostridium sp.]|nr:chitobiase/beta-hexosaminidase C-terminal domain-containing protein [Ruminiclostridium sp.]